jgi:nanoRNase/pAp phosphatase (c-di-AMP/oligoRNAs hydrolase)|tara:strand:+ start:68 stop:298 length:231 start_codon:yes stop_codon:yes gene_type:complete
MKKIRKEAKLLGYALLYDKSGNLVTERTSVDIKALEEHMPKQEFETLKIVLREATQKMDAIHSHIEECLNARVMNN